MIKSRTKYEADNRDIVRIFEKHNIKNIGEITPLGYGEFNAAYRVGDVIGNSGYVLKIAPPKEARVLTYEVGIMQSEVCWYDMMSRNTDIRIPKVYAQDFSCELIDSPYFIMEFFDGKPLWEAGLSAEEYEKAQNTKTEMLARIHRIHNNRFGYVQNGLHNTWYEAVCSMTENLIADCESIGKDTPDGRRFLSVISRHRDILSECPCSMVNFDLWDSNLLCNSSGELCLIDPERGFYGDYIADFVTLGGGQKVPLGDKIKETEIYNRVAEKPLIYGKNAEIRYQTAVGLLALIEEVEKYVRYEPHEDNYIRNTEDARAMFDMVFDIL